MAGCGSSSPEQEAMWLTSIRWDGHTGHVCREITGKKCNKYFFSYDSLCFCIFKTCLLNLHECLFWRGINKMEIHSDLFSIFVTPVTPTYLQLHVAWIYNMNNVQLHIVHNINPCIDGWVMKIYAHKSYTMNVVQAPNVSPLMFSEDTQ